jgi:hypothetical protein
MFGLRGAGVTKGGGAVGVEIAKRFDTTLSPASPNRISAQQLKEWAVEYLSSRVL